MLYYDRIDLSEEIDVTKVTTEKNLWFVTIIILIMGLNFKIQFAIVVMIS